ncbi:MAG: hypothetical protein ACRCZD_22535, partial [Phycicoccus sp.]
MGLRPRGLTTPHPSRAACPGRLPSQPSGHAGRTACSDAARRVTRVGAVPDPDAALLGAADVRDIAGRLGIRPT